jgi:hypothetical protein
MAAASLRAAVEEIERLLALPAAAPQAEASDASSASP